MHSGWGALVAVSHVAGAVEILERRRITVIEPKIPGTKQPYHFSERLEFAEAEKFLSKCFEASTQFAVAAIRQCIEGLRERKYAVAGAAMVMASGRTLPPLANILSSHALIHTAEGEFFREPSGKRASSSTLQSPDFENAISVKPRLPRSKKRHQKCSVRFSKPAASSGRPGPPTRKPLRLPRCWCCRISRRELRLFAASRIFSICARHC